MHMNFRISLTFLVLVCALILGVETGKAQSVCGPAPKSVTLTCRVNYSVNCGTFDICTLLTCIQPGYSCARDGAECDSLPVCLPTALTVLRSLP